ncbi:MAG: hypothetical protein ACTSPI_00005 [Candidatus Heimdallarchaeaceae archaeon]
MSDMSAGNAKDISIEFHINKTNELTKVYGLIGDSANKGNYDVEVLGSLTHVILEILEVDDYKIKERTTGKGRVTLISWEHLI